MVQTGLYNGLNRFTFVQTSLHQIIKAALHHKGVGSEEDCVIWDRAKVWTLRRAMCHLKIVPKCSSDAHFRRSTLLLHILLYEHCGFDHETLFTQWHNGHYSHIVFHRLYNMEVDIFRRGNIPELFNVFERIS